MEKELDRLGKALALDEDEFEIVIIPESDWLKEGKDVGRFICGRGHHRKDN